MEVIKTFIERVVIIESHLLEDDSVFQSFNQKGAKRKFVRQHWAKFHTKLLKRMYLVLEHLHIWA